MENELVDPIEQRVVAVEGVKEVRSSITQGSANISLEFDIGRNIDAALQEVQANIQQIRLPLNVSPPRIYKRNIEDDPIIRVVVYGDRPLREMADYVDKYLETEIQTVDGVGDVSVGGFGARQLRVVVDNDKLKQYQLTILDVQQALQDQHQETAGGYLENAKNEINVRTLGEGLTAAQVGNELILKRGGAPIYSSTIHLRDVAEVIDDLSDVRNYVRADGQPAVVVNIRKQRGQNEVTVADNVMAKINAIQHSLPPGMKTQVVVDFTKFTRTAVAQTLHELIVAGILTSIICYLFLGTWSSSVNVLIAIPTSIIGAFTALYFLGFTLNLFTLLALALAIGIVVDDAIIVLENIVRHYAMGKSRRKAALDGAREITFAAVAATVAVVAIFIPVAFIGGVIGKFFFQFAITMTVAVLLSLLEAITLTPMRCAKMLGRASQGGLLVWVMDRFFHQLSERYRAALDWALNRRITILTVSILLFAVSLLAASQLRQEFIPSQDQNFFHVYLETPMGSSLSFTDEKVRLVEDYFKHQPVVAHYVGNTGNGRSNAADFDVVLINKELRREKQSQIIDRFRAELNADPAIAPYHIRFRDISGRGLSTRQPAPLSFNLRGAEYDVLYKAAKDIEAKLKSTGLVTDIDDDYRVGMPEAQVMPDRQAASERGLTVDEIGQTINTAIGGYLQGQFTSGGHRYDINIRLKNTERTLPADIAKLDVRTQYGELIPLNEVSSVQVNPTLQTVSRIDRQRSISVSGALAPGASQAKVLGLAEQYARESLPPGYDFHLDGSAAGYQSAFGGLWFALILGIAVAYMVLATQFDSFLHPVSVLLALPFSLTGALVALWSTNESLNMFSMIGIILLMGIVKKNSILLVEFTNHVRQQDKRPLRAALLDACPIRLRPILMTSLATMASAVPSALGFGPGSETRMPMATAVIGGIFVSTCFTLFVVPCAYSLLANLERNRDDDDEPEEPREIEVDSSDEDSAEPTSVV